MSGTTTVLGVLGSLLRITVSLVLSWLMDLMSPAFAAVSMSL